MLVVSAPSLRPPQVRLLDIDLGQSGITYQPGDVLAVVPQQSAAAVEALCRRCGWDPNAWVRVEPVCTQAAAAAVEAGTPPAAGEDNGSSAAAGACSCTVRLGALIAGALDIDGASPRRFFFQASAGQLAGCRLMGCLTCLLGWHWATAGGASLLHW